MAITIPTVDVAMTDGTEHTGVRLSVKQQLQWSRTARARGWPVDDQMLATLFMTWHALHSQDLYQGTWEEFEDAAQWVQENDPEDKAPADAEDRPTIPAS